jgi:hypothetical protein
LRRRVDLERDVRGLGFWHERRLRQGTNKRRRPLRAAARDGVHVNDPVIKDGAFGEVGLQGEVGLGKRGEGGE